MNNKLVIYTDGGSRGNPGPAAIGVVIVGDEIGKKEYGEYVGEVTNNVAEYKALIFALKKAKQLLGNEKSGSTVLEANLDSELLVKQLNGEYKVKESEMRNLFMEVWNLKMDFREVIFKHIPREKNTQADKIVNQVLDREGNKLNL